MSDIMWKFAKIYARNEAGSVSAETVGMIATAALLAVAVIGSVSNGANDFSNALADHIAATQEGNY